MTRFFWLSLAIGSEANGSVPDRVRPKAKGWGGGSADSIGHMKPMQEQAGGLPVKELFEVPTWEEFHREYIATNTPVIFRGGAKSQAAFEKWTDFYLADQFGGRKISVELNKTETRGGKTKNMKLSSFVKEMYSEEKKDQYYAVVDFDTDKTARADFTAPAPANCKEVLFQSLTLWMSSGGTTSVLHQDDAENFLMLLDGKKTVMLVHQDYAQKMYAPIAEAGGTSPVHQEQVDLVNFPKFQDIKWLSGTILPGDTLYIPHTYWHQVNSYGRNLAANLWWGHQNDYQWWDPNNKEYSGMHFGSKGWIKFDELKKRGGSDYPCTVLQDGDNLNAINFVEEGKYKQQMSTKHRKAAKAKSQAEL